MKCCKSVATIWKEKKKSDNKYAIEKRIFVQRRNYIYNLKYLTKRYKESRTVLIVMDFVLKSAAVPDCAAAGFMVFHCTAT